MTSRRLRIALFAALPWEHGAFRRGLGRWERFSAKPFKAFSLSMGDKDLLLVETGMGGAMVETAMNWAFWTWRPHMLVSFGFSGGLSPSVGVGDTFLCSELFYFDSMDRAIKQVRYRIEPHPEILPFCRIHGITEARCVTSLHLEPKSFLRSDPGDALRPQGAMVRDGFVAMDPGDGLRPQGAVLEDQSLSSHPGDVPVLVDMESHFAARFASEQRLPLLCFRAVSDTRDQEIGFELSEVSSAQGRVDLLRVCRTIVRDPAVFMAFMASWRRSRRAERSLARLLKSLVELPASRIRAILGPGVSWPEAQSDP